MGKEIATQVQETQRVANSKGKTTNNTQGIPTRITADLSIETLQAER